MLKDDVKNVGTMLMIAAAGMVIGYVKCLNDTLKVSDQVEVKPTKHTILKVRNPKKKEEL